MSKCKHWRVVLDAEKAPAIGDWVAIDGLVPGTEEWPRFTFLDNSTATGFTFLEGARARGMRPSLQDREMEHANGTIPWLHFPDCMEIVGVERLDWCPDGWTRDATLWLLTVKSLPSNIEFEKRLLANDESQKKKKSVVEKIRRWCGVDV